MLRPTIPLTTEATRTDPRRRRMERTVHLSEKGMKLDRFLRIHCPGVSAAARLLAEAVKLFYPEGERQEKGGSRRA